MTQLLVVLLLASAEGSPEGSPPPAATPVTPADAPATAAADAPTSSAPSPTVEGSGPRPEFVKGELSAFLGSDRLVAKHNRVGVSAGLDRVGTGFYLVVEPQIDLRFLEQRLALGIGVPLRFELLNFYGGSGVRVLSWELRKEDYDQPSDFAKVLKYVTYGRKEDRLYFNLGQRYSSTIGHGAIVRRYSPNIDVDVTRVSAQVDAYNDFAGFELLTNDIVEWNLLSGLVFLKPLSLFGDGVVARSLSVGLSASTDLSAPRSLATEGPGLRSLDGAGRIAAARAPVVLAGVDAEVKVIKTDAVDVKPFVDYSMLLGGDGGLTLGVLGRFNAGQTTVQAFRAIAELRWLGARYQPGYFDTFYEVERYVARELPRDGDFAHYQTKYEDTLSGRLGQRVGYYLEGSWGIRSRFAFTLAFEGSSGQAGKNLVAHLEVPALNFVQFFGSYYKRGFVEVGELAAFDDRSVLFVGTRLKVLPVLFVNARAYKSFRLNPEIIRYDNAFGWSIDLEVGWEFTGGRARPPPEPASGSEATEPDPAGA